LNNEELSAIRETACRFARQEVAKLVGTEGRDGDLGELGRLLERAAEIGLLAAADPDSPGYEYGVWGRVCDDEGPAGSLAVLKELAVECAGVAACVHFAGLGAAELAGDVDVGETATVAFFDRGWRASQAAFDRPPAGAASIRDDRLSGESSFVFGAPGSRTYVVYAAGAEGWERVRVKREADGLGRTEVGRRTGLAALAAEHLKFNDVAAGTAERLPFRTPHSFVRRLMLGLAAIAVGNARGAVNAARRYAEERYQGGGKIGGHAAVQGLLGGSHSRLAMMEHCLDGAAALSDGGAAALWHSLAAKLRITLECDQAVTDSLQVLGGYGYMEDYRLEKRLRDSMTLKTMCVAPATLRLLCAVDPGGER